MTGRGKRTFNCAPEGAIAPAAQECSKRCPNYALCRAKNDAAREHYNDEGLNNLIYAVTLQAMRDYMRARDPGIRKYIADQITSDHFERLSGLNGATIITALKSEERRKKRHGC